MTTNELFTKITSVKLWYKPTYSKQNAYIIKKKHDRGTLTEQFYTQFFAKFGYIKAEAEWMEDTSELLIK